MNFSYYVLSQQILVIEESRQTTQVIKFSHSYFTRLASLFI